MKNILAGILIFGSGVILIEPLSAQELGLGDINKYIDQPATKGPSALIGDEIGVLRGFIEGDLRVAVDGHGGSTGKETDSAQWLARENIDPVITTNIARGSAPNLRGFAVKFDSDGNPMAHHQEYPRPSPLAIASSIFNSLEMNTYPGDE